MQERNIRKQTLQDEEEGSMKAPLIQVPLSNDVYKRNDLDSNVENFQHAARKDRFGLGSQKTQDIVKLLFGAGGIYASFLYYGTLQEDVFDYVNPKGLKFTQAWFLQVLEATTNVLVGYIGMKLSGQTSNIPKKYFIITGASQVCSKAFTNMSLAYGLSFPVAMLAKSGKMAPVMAGQLLLGGSNYHYRDYMQVAAIIGGTVLLSLQKKKGNQSNSSIFGVFFILLSLAMDGVTGGFQKRLKTTMKQTGHNPKPYDFMYWTNMYMMLVAFVIAMSLGEVTGGTTYCMQNPLILKLIVKFSFCSAIGQSFIFYTVAHFDPLVCSTVTTTRKIFTVLLSIFLKGHPLNIQGWFGVCLACSGILSEVHSKLFNKKQSKSKMSS